MIGDEPVAERAPIVDLWIKLARRNGAEVVRVAEPELGEELEQRVSSADRRGARLVRPRRRRRRAPRGARAPARLRRQARLRAPSTSPPRRTAAASPTRGRRPPTATSENPEPIGLLIVSGDEAAADPAVRALAERAEHVLAITMFQGLAVGWADLVLPGTSYLERDGTYVNLEGRVQRLRRAVIPPAAGRARLDREARRALRRRALAARRPSSSRSSRERLYGGMPFGEVGERAPLPERTPYRRRPAGSAAPARPRRRRRREHFLGDLSLSATGRSSPARPSSACPSSQFQRPAPRSSSPPPTPSGARSRRGDDVSVRSNGTCVALRARVSRALPKAPPASPRSTPPTSTGTSRWSKA